MINVYISYYCFQENFYEGNTIAPPKYYFIDVNKTQSLQIKV